MGYVIGLANEEHIEELKRRGWEVEDAPEALNTAENEPDEPDPLRSIMIWVDSDVLEIMDGPTWEGSPARAAVEDMLENLEQRSHEDIKKLLQRLLLGRESTPCTERPNACSPGCPGWAWFESAEHGFMVEGCDDCKLYQGDLEAELHILNCDECRKLSKKQLEKILEHLKD